MLFTASWQRIILFAGLISLSILLLLAFFFWTDTGFGIISWTGNLIEGDPPVPPANEIVMPPDTSIKAVTGKGAILVKAGKGLKRYYSWEGVTRSVVMWPREKRWHGSLGIYYPGPGRHWLIRHNGIGRCVVEEGQRHFNSEAEALSWLSRLRKSTFFSTVYRDDGLVVSLGKSLAREQLNVDVWQIFINGKKPLRLEGSENLAIEASWDRSN